MRFKNITLIALFSVLFAGAVSAQTFFTEEFDGAIPAEWTNIEVEGNGTESSVWFHTTTGPSQAYAGDVILSTTAANGWVIFDSDLNNNEGANQNAWLISPVVDATDKTAVWLVFETSYRNWDDRPQVRVGSDLNDLDSWATIEVWPGIGAGEYGDGNPEIVKINLTEWAAGQEFNFAFQFLSDATTNTGGGTSGWAYAWQIDDVSLTDQSPLAPVDLKVTDWHAVAPNAVTPGSQVTAMGFVLDIENAGSGIVDASTINIEISDNTGVVFTDSHDYGTLAPGELHENYLFDTYTPSAVPSGYTGTYTVTPGAGDDGDIANNSVSFNFIVSDSLFSKEFDYTRSVAPADDNNFGYSNIYYVPNGDGMFARYVSFGVSDSQGALAGKSCNIFLYEWEGDTNEDGYVNTAEMTGGSPIGFNSYEFDGSEHLQLLTLPMDIDGEAIPLQDGKYYVIAIQYVAQADENMFLLASEEIDYQPMNYTTDSLNTNDNTFPIQYASALDVGNSGEYFILGFGWDLVPMIRMSVGNNDCMTCGALVNTKETILSEGSVGVFPNPVDKAANIHFDLTEMSDKVTLELFNSNGRLVSKTKYDNVQAETISLNVANLPVGNYKLRARTDAGIKTVNVSIQR